MRRECLLCEKRGRKKRRRRPDEMQSSSVGCPYFVRPRERYDREQKRAGMRERFGRTHVVAQERAQGSHPCGNGKETQLLSFWSRSNQREACQEITMLKTLNQEGAIRTMSVMSRNGQEAGRCNGPVEERASEKRKGSKCTVS